MYLKQLSISLELKINKKVDSKKSIVKIERPLWAIFLEQARMKISDNLEVLKLKQTEVKLQKSSQ